MRLLNANTRLLEEFPDASISPRYVILSHTWDKEEVTLQDLQGDDYKSKLGYRKIDGCCIQALAEGYDYVWVDTCCIDKKDSSELSEAINSMYQWYTTSAVCYVYLTDVEVEEGKQIDFALLEKSRWFSRGWTLQELLAPSKVVFFDHRWRAFGFTGKGSDSNDVPDITSMLSAITRIDRRILRDKRLIHRSTAAERFSWAAHRQTTRKEDMAYCLLGILGVNMPLLYGEGEKAFIRLQQEYIRQYNDPTLLLWGYGIPCQDSFWRSASDWALAPSVSFFSGFNPSLCMERNVVLSTFSCTNNGVEIELLLLDIDEDVKIACFGTRADFPLHHQKPSERTSPSPLLSSLLKLSRKKRIAADQPIIALPLLYRRNYSRGGFDIYERALLWPPFLIPEDLCRNAKWTKVYIRGVNVRSVMLPPSKKISRDYSINIEALANAGFSLDAVYPPTNVFSQATRIIHQVQAEGIHRIIFTFKGPHGLFLILYAEYEFLHLKLSKLCISVGQMTMIDVLGHLLQRGEALSERARGKALANLGRSLQGALDPNASSFKIPGKRLGTPGLDATVSAVVRSGFANANFRSILLQWEQH